MIDLCLLIRFIEISCSESQTKSWLTSRAANRSFSSSSELPASARAPMLSSSERILITTTYRLEIRSGRSLKAPSAVDSIRVSLKPSEVSSKQEDWSVMKLLSRSSTRKSRNQSQQRESFWTVSQELKVSSISTSSNSPFTVS